MIVTDKNERAIALYRSAIRDFGREIWEAKQRSDENEAKRLEAMLKKHAVLFDEGGWVRDLDLNRTDVEVSRMEVRGSNI